MTEEHRNWIAKRIIDAIRAQPDDCISVDRLESEVLAKPRPTRMDYLAVLADLALRWEIRYLTNEEGYDPDVIMLADEPMEYMVP